MAREYGGKCNLRFDDTNPSKEDVEYVDSIMEDVRWLGFDWDDRLFYASDYFEQLYHWAEQLIKAGKAYVCDLNGEQMREYRGTLTEPGKNSPYRNRSIEENLDLFRRMRAGEFPDGRACCGPRSTWPRPTSTCATRSCIASCTPRIIALATMVHLPDVRLRARPVGLDRADHAFDLHAGIREPSPAVRLVPGESGDLSTRSRSNLPG